MAGPGVLEGAALVIHVTHDVTDAQILGALGKRVTSKVSRIAVIRDHDRLRTLRWIDA